ncbi:hypothetical protein [Undibacterium sp.]|uniref:hypothetical protein n=1 Tax=Undibacterium sp. TaxID=1914977 RepID=UPI0025F70A9F|nr:hypothetical protein [Undibacterium sp.]
MNTNLDVKKATGFCPVASICVKLNLLKTAFLRVRLPRLDLQATASGDIWGRHVGKRIHKHSVNQFWVFCALQYKILQKNLRAL